MIGTKNEGENMIKLNKQVEALADVPGREVLLGRLFGSMQSPVANFARVIKQVAEKDPAAAAAAAPAEEAAPAAEEVPAAE